MFNHVAPYAGDPILSLMEAFEQDPRANKINLSIGLYYDNEGAIPLPAAALAAECELFEDEQGASLYLPMEGLAAYRSGIQALLFGEEHPAVNEKRVATVQTVGGSGALKIGADFLKRYYSQSQVWVSDPTWANHHAIFTGAGFTVGTYPYFDAATGGVRFDAMLQALQTLPAQSIVLLHPCCHNPTGADLTPTQWDQVTEVVKARDLIAFLDIAYQGFGDGMEEDAYAIRAMANAGVNCLVSNSFSKIFSLYGERVGGLSVVCDDAHTADNVLGQLQFTIRQNYSSPPRHGAQIVAKVLSDTSLKASWTAEVEAMRLRIVSMREQLVARLSAALPDQDFSFFLTQKGMFSYTGFTAAQVDRLREEQAVYLIGSGRICMAGLNEENLEPVAQAFIRLYGARAQ
ncbi:amino acid aminotransferase [Pseudomonas sp. R5(2019)]|uniref:amino acid aminotransferase n=1 Tax=Pseudomonas sp. R5(2019) TaxID=2697566 RepID=UPI00141333ED|nr:amino acid aminotransferase [Pseudomonas sp. R5(2019)]NBA95947.1 aminotransferase class I/II-fold pyridoxal phosphate-dependent enzyme [Pseudomonas sp. R5(2019)]